MQTPKIFLITVAILLLCGQVFAEELLIDDFEKNSNYLGGRSNTYVKEPSRVIAYRTEDEFYGESGRSLMIKYDKKSKGGPYGFGGWCGYYTQVRSGSRYFDATEFKSITFWVKGVKGDENFRIGLADRHWDQVGDSVKSEQIGKYLPEGRITAQWQKAVIPLDEFFLDFKRLASIAICFETDCFPSGGGQGTIYIDDLKFE